MLNTFVAFVLYAIVAGAVEGLLLYAVAISPVPEPFKGRLRFAVTLIAIFVVMGLIGGALPRIRVGLGP